MAKMILFTFKLKIWTSITQIDGELYFVGNTMAKALHFEDLEEAVRKYVPKAERFLLTIIDVDGNPITEEVITFQGLLRLMENAPQSDDYSEFFHWILLFVLPKFREADCKSIVNNIPRSHYSLRSVIHSHSHRNRRKK